MANPFDDDADISSFYKPQNKSSSTASKKATSPSDDLNFYEQQIEQILQNTVDSSNRGVLMLEQSEQIGIATAQDLVTQGEKLHRVDRQLDEINATAKQSQRHLNNIKSIFGGIKNYFSKAPPTAAAAADKGDLPPPDSKLNQAVNRIEQQAQRDFCSPPAGASSSLSESTRNVVAGTRWDVMNTQVDENLDSMSANLRRLRQLGSALGEEIDDQNAILDKIGGKAERADVEIRNQDRQMKRILNGPGQKKQPANANNDQDQSAAQPPPPSLFGARFKK